MTYGKRNLGHVVVKAKLLKSVTEVGGINAFEAKNKFRKGKTVDGVKIAWLGPNFVKNFLEKTEKNVAPATDIPILTERNNTTGMTLAGFWELLKKQGGGQSGDLFVNGYANVADIRDVNDKPWAVNAYWNVGYRGWSIEAGSVASPYRWNPDFRIYFR